MQARAAVVLVGVVMAGCLSMGGPGGGAAPAQPPGPVLVTEVANASDRQRMITFDFAGGASSGGGEGPIDACQRVAMQWGGPIVGNYTISIDGVQVVGDTVPAGLADGVFLVVRLAIDPDGTARPIGTARVTRLAPDPEPVPIPGC